MEITKIEDKKNKLIFKIEGEGHTFCSILKDELNKVKGVVVASYNQDHPLIGLPKMIIETDGSISPKDALEQAIKATKKDSSDFKKLVEKEL
ncbi:DNA-directed RNA polymerase subunit L [Candidatus Woesearchaeota archaeon]|nr:DNA-directed RNA polymerase subunit L [Candidatus Woesearchaeota archaeon]